MEVGCKMGACGVVAGSSQFAVHKPLRHVGGIYFFAGYKLTATTITGHSQFFYLRVESVEQFFIGYVFPINRGSVSFPFEADLLREEAVISMKFSFW